MKNKIKKGLVGIGTFLYSAFGIQKIVNAATQIQLYAMTRYGEVTDTKFDVASPGSELNESLVQTNSNPNYKITLPVAILFFAIGLLSYSFGKTAKTEEKKKSILKIGIITVSIGIVLGIVSVILLIKK
jgi:hypothetical protein